MKLKRFSDVKYNEVFAIFARAQNGIYNKYCVKMDDTHYTIMKDGVTKLIHPDKLDKTIVMVESEQLDHLPKGYQSLADEVDQNFIFASIADGVYQPLLYTKI